MTKEQRRIARTISMCFKDSRLPDSTNDLMRQKVAEVFAAEYMVKESDRSTFIALSVRGPYQATESGE